MSRLGGKVALVTGAAGGIGRGSATMLAQSGAKVAIVDIDLARAEATAAEIRAAGAEALAVAADVRDEAQVAEMVRATVQAFGGLDILHNNAAALSPEVQHADDNLLTMDIELWDLILEVNLRGVMLGCKHAIPHMIERGGGAVINTASVQAFGSTPTMPAYAASKAAIVSLTKSVAVQFGARGIRCNAVGPSFTVTPAAMSYTTAERREYLKRLHPAARLGTPEDIGRAVVFLADEEQSGYVTGHLLMVDGGRMALLSGSTE